MAAAVLLAYLISSVAGLPEGLWAVMSALIVMRMRAGSTLTESGNRILGTLLGAVGGLLGVGLHNIGVNAIVATLGVVAVLAFVTAWLPVWRTAPITALIVLSGGMAGHSSWQTAGLRVAEIVIGIVAGVAVSLFLAARHSAEYFEQSLQTLLREIAEHTRRSLTQPNPSADEREESGRALRSKLMRLSLLAASADTEQRLSLGKRRVDAEQKEFFRRRAALVSRIAQDAAIFGRIREARPEQREHSLWGEVIAAIEAALAYVAGENDDCIKDDETLKIFLQQLRRSQPLSPQETELYRLLEAPLTLLSVDISALRNA